MTRFTLFISSLAVSLFAGACAQSDSDALPRRRTPALDDSGTADATGASGGATLCDRACSRVYDTCRRSLSNGNGVLSRAQCVSECAAGGFGGAPSCLSDAPCTTDAISGCFAAIPIGRDAGAGSSDSGFSSWDSGVPAVDSGGAISDSGVPPLVDAGAPSSHSCATACGHIYNDCGVTLTQSGSPLTRAQCEAHCGATSNYRNNAGCLSTMACTMDAFYSCLAMPGGGVPPVDSGVPTDAGLATDSGGGSMGACTPPTTGFCTSVGCFARPTTFTAIDNSTHALYGSAFCAASATVVIVSAGWCGVCQSEAPAIERDITAAYRARGVRVLTLIIENPDRSPGTVAFANSWHSRYSLTSTTVIDPARDWLRAVTISGVPAVTVLDRAGRIRHHTSGVSITQVRSALDNILAGR